MSRKARHPQTPRHVLIYDEDWEYLETRFGPAGLQPVGVSTVIRAVIHNKVLALREAENRALTARRRLTLLNSPPASSLGRNEPHASTDINDPERDII